MQGDAAMPEDELDKMSESEQAVVHSTYGNSEVLFQGKRAGGQEPG